MCACMSLNANVYDSFCLRSLSFSTLILSRSAWFSSSNGSAALVMGIWGGGDVSMFRRFKFGMLSGCGFLLEVGIIVPKVLS
jgi:hypothetical protein